MRLLSTGPRAAALAPVHAGVNRHEHDPRRGKVVSLAAMLEDARLMKRLNFNAVRCSHYPDRDAWYEVCALVGLYVVDEANHETHGFDPSLRQPELNPCASPAWLSAILGEAWSPCRTARRGCEPAFRVGAQVPASAPPPVATPQCRRR